MSPPLDQRPNEVHSGVPVCARVDGSFVPISLEYEILSAVPGEDNEGLLGTDRIRHVLDDRSPKYYSLPIVFSSGFKWLDFSVTPGVNRLLNLLSSPI
jgi:hypothetical protein